VKKVVVDTNILLVANGQHQDISLDCEDECIHLLTRLQKHGVTVLDDDFRILGEYQHKTSLNPPKGVGDVFLKFLLREQGNQKRVEQVTITEVSTNIFKEFPDNNLQPQFDAPDRKFAAVANAHPDKPPILQAADCKWLDSFVLRMPVNFIPTSFQASPFRLCQRNNEIPRRPRLPTRQTMASF
jgi:hypothetical protein